MSDTIEYEFIPLDKRVCIDLMMQGNLGPDGRHPVCLGPTCSKFEQCLLAIENANVDLDALGMETRP